MAINSYARKRDGKLMWRVRLRDSQGNWYGQTFFSKRDAEEYERVEKSKKFRGTVLARYTFAEVSEEWLGSNRNKAEGTIEKDRSILDLHVLPVLGDREIRKITRNEIQELVNSWWPPRFHAETVRRMYSTMRAVFSYARRHEYIDADRCTDINIPEREPRVVAVAMIEDDGGVRVDMTPYRRLAEELGSYYGLMVDLALMGLRWGEIAGLQAQDIGSTKMRHTINVERQLTRGQNGNMTLKSRTKSYRAMRHGMIIPASLGEKMAAHIADHELVEGDFLFLSPDGKPLHYSNWRRNIWEPALLRAMGTGADFHFHDLKHVATKLLSRTAVSDKVRENRLGNSVRVQDDVYESATHAEDWEAANALEELMYGEAA
jgi:integrase